MKRSACKRKIGRQDSEKKLEQDAKRLRMEFKWPVRLLDLPLGPLHLIFSKVPLEKQKLLRNVSKEMRDEHNDFILHNYKAFNCKLSKIEEHDNVDHNVLRVVEDATIYLVNSGYVADIMNNLPHFFQDPENINVENMQKLLHRCYHQIEWSPRERPSGVAGRILLHRRRSVYMVTLLNLLRQFHGYRKVGSRMNLLHWQLHIELKGVHITANNERNPKINEADKLIDLMTLIAELLVNDMSESGPGFSRYMDIGNSTYNYGLKRRQLGRGSRLDLKFTILAPLALRNLMEDVLAGKIDKSTAIKCPLFDSFSIQLDLKNFGVNWINDNTWQICILPLI
ncbi:uncharacterized protein LOC117788823 isoform X2 [Drosophila innubila]|uniref:uncharacterized protein LOC117788823 isoform X2 n=1 Tax=Drosophila innubila TaxID=198719 RepID=UPI00148E4448|nr:uncharacterized protein LOC117788823 isoform X2 [Drosophila innubila]